MKRRILCLFNISLGLLSLAVVASAIHRFAPPAFIPDIDDKLAWFRQHKDEYDTLFLGSSRINFHIQPRLFDAEMQKAGHPSKSFNFGISAMMPPESSHLLEQILALNPASLKRIFVEIYPLQTRIERNNKHTARVAYWHDLPRTQLILQKGLLDIQDATETFRESANPVRQTQAREKIFKVADELLFHLQLFLKNHANIGRGPEMLQCLLHCGPCATETPLGEGRDGYLPPPQQPLTPERIQIFTDGMKQISDKPVKADRCSEEEFRRIAALIRAHKAEPVFLSVPCIARPYSYFHKRPADCPLLEFSDPQKYPSFYNLTKRIDINHFNPEGAEEFTTALAQQFIAHLHRQEQNITSAHP